MFYLSPDAEEALLEFDENTSFVIGGLIDRTVVKNASLDRAKTLDLQARRLPITEFCKDKVVKTELGINQVVRLLLGYRESQDWSIAFEQAEVIPKRYKS